MEEQSIEFKTAVLAKEKGFKEYTNEWWKNAMLFNLGYGTLSDAIPNLVICNETSKILQIPTNIILRPTQSLLQKWLREIQGIHINIDFGIGWGYQLIPIGWTGKQFGQKFIDGIDTNTYEEALEQGLQEALKLIK